MAWSRPSMHVVLPGVWSRLRRALRVLGVGAAAVARGEGGREWGELCGSWSGGERGVTVRMLSLVAGLCEWRRVR